MPDRSAVLTRGRGAVLLFSAGLVATLCSGWLRHHLLTLATSTLVGLPWLPLRRVALGFLLDLPAALVTVAACVVAYRLVVLRPLPTVLALTATVWLLDLAMAWLVVGDMRLWTDPLIVAARVVVVLGTVAAGARALGWRPGKAKENEPDETSET